MKALGVYFGPKFITLVETEGLKVICNVQIPLSRLSVSGVEEKIPEEIKIAAAIKDEIRKNEIEAKEANLVLMGRDLIIRTFLIPVLPANELNTAVRFEAKKYIPFKVEDLAYDFQVSLDRANRKNMVLFVGLKKENLNRYISIFNQLNIKVNSVEYGGFSVLRLIQLAKTKGKGIFVAVNIDLVEEDEVNFIVLENGLPLFSRDIIVSGETAFPDYNQPVKTDLAGSLEKMKVELRISLDFYLRKFPTKNISNMIAVVPEDYRQDIEAFVRERGLGVKFVDPRKLPDRPMIFSLGFFKAYAASLKKQVKTPIRIDLLSDRAKAKAPHIAGMDKVVLSGLKINVKFIFLAVAVILLPFLIIYLRSQPIRMQLASIVVAHPKVTTVNPTLSYEKLESINNKYREKIKAINLILKQRVFVSGVLDSIPRSISEGLWLNDFNLKVSSKNLVILNILGVCYLADNDKERKSINKFLNNLKSNSNFNNLFKEVNIVSLDQQHVGKIVLTGFSIECRSK
jgi:hypothetical protein